MTADWISGKRSTSQSAHEHDIQTVPNPTITSKFIKHVFMNIFTISAFISLAAFMAALGKDEKSVQTSFMLGEDEKGVQAVFDRKKNTILGLFRPYRPIGATSSFKQKVLESLLLGVIVSVFFCHVGVEFTGFSL